MLRATIGPLWTHGGLFYWKLYLYDDAVVAFPYGLMGSIAAACRVVTKRRVPEPRSAVKGRRVGTEGARRYELPLISGIEAVSSYAQNSIVITRRSGERHRYTIPLRAETDTYRSLLGALYPEIYTERDFPRTKAGRFLKR